MGIFKYTFTRRTPAHKYKLNRIDLKVKKGELVAVVGAVGSGKSSLVAALLGETVKVNGNVNVSVRFACK